MSKPTRDSSSAVAQRRAFVVRAFGSVVALSTGTAALEAQAQAQAQGSAQVPPTAQQTARPPAQGTAAAQGTVAPPSGSAQPAPTAQGATGEGTIGLGALGTLGGPRMGGPRPFDGPTSRAHVRFMPPQVTGALAPEVVRRVLRRHGNELRFCYERALETNSTLAGALTLRFNVTREGVVERASIDRTDQAFSQVTTCITRALQRWSFPVPEQGVVSVVYPIVLERLDAQAAPPAPPRVRGSRM